MKQDLKILKESFLQWDWRLFFFIFLFIALPNVYQQYRVFLIGNEIPGTNNLSIVAQWQFVGIIVEIFQEAAVLSIFFFLGSQIKSSLDVKLDRIKTVIIFVVTITVIASVLLFFFSEQFVSFIETPQEIADETVRYLNVSIFSIPFTILAVAAIVILEAFNKRILILVMSLLTVLFRFAFDSLFFGGYTWSLDLGVIGVGWSDLLSSILLFVVAIILLLITLRPSIKNLLALPKFSAFKVYLGVGLGSGIDSLVRNVAFFFMIIRLINTVGTDEIGGYWLSIQIFWSFLLIPVLAFAESGRALFANYSSDRNKIRKLWYSAMLITTLFMLIWVALIPAIRPFTELLNPNEVTVNAALTSITILFVPYVLFSYNTVTDSLFYGLGKTRFMAYQSIITNGTVYVIAFILYITDVWQVTYESILLLFALGILVDSILTMLFAAKILYFSKKKNDKEQVAVL